MNCLRGCEITQLEIAKDFYEAYKRCLISHDNHHVAIPAFANGFFSCELFLKCILKSYDKKSSGHNLLELFKSLPIALRDAIKEEFSNNAKEFLAINKTSFYGLLEKIADGFEFWRYIFEDKNRAIENFEKKYPFGYSEGFLQYFLPIIDRIATDIDRR